jgi:hypothetical protein
MDDIERAAVRELLDRQAILDCLHRYARGVDRVDEELILSAYHEDAIDDHGTAGGDFVGSPKEFVAWVRSVDERVTATQHYLTNHSVELDGDVAHAESYFISMLRFGDVVRLGGGRYLDRFERRDGAWRIAARVVVGEWSTELEQAAWEAAPVHLPRRDRSDLSYARPLETRRP